MQAELYWIRCLPDKKLAIMPRPRGGDWLEEEIASCKRQGLDVIVSLLEEHEAQELDLEQEAEICQSVGISFIHFPIADQDVPASGEQLHQIVSSLKESLESGYGVGIHCRMGIGRSALVAACLLCREGLKVEEAFEKISEARNLPVPDTEEQKDWVQGWLERHPGLK